MTDMPDDAARLGPAGPADRQSYYAMSRSWSDDRLDALAASRRVAWIVASLAIAIALLEALALVALAPLKTVVPYTLMVDRTTGYAQMLEGTRSPSISPQSALTQSLLAQYVIARETFDIGSVSDQYQKVALWSAEGARADYLMAMPASNPASPINLYPRSTVVQTRIESVSPIAPMTVMVRFVTERRDAGQGQGRPMYWAAIIRYRYSGEPMSLADRLVNPLGFQVVSYRREQEAAPVADAPESPQVGPGQGRAAAAGTGLALGRDQ